MDLKELAEAFRTRIISVGIEFHAFRYSDGVFVAADDFRAVASGHVPFLDYGKIESRASAKLKLLHHVRPPEPDAELVAGKSRLGDAEYGRPDAQTVAEVNRVFEQAFERQVFAEHPPPEVVPSEPLGPIGIVFGGVAIHSLVRPSMDGGVGLSVPCDIQPLDAHAPSDRALEDASQDFFPVHSDFTRQAHVHGDNSHAVQFIMNSRESGGTGRRARLRIWSRKGWGFESPLSHYRKRD